jgi:hypothetical protein
MITALSLGISGMAALPAELGQGFFSFFSLLFFTCPGSPPAFIPWYSVMQLALNK